VAPGSTESPAHRRPLASQWVRISTRPAPTP
jgi:hypothetical protein